MGVADAYRSAVENQWCPGCPNFGILAAVKKSLAQLGLAPHEVCLVSGIGQAAKLPHYLQANVYNGLHGRAIPAALGIHVANPKLKILVTSGDGDLYGEGGNHLLHAFRRNPDITVIVHDNRIYALTKGQASPTTPRGERTRLQFGGVEIDPAQMLATAIVSGCTFVARGFAGDIDGLTLILVRAIEHRGLSLVDVIQPCITWGNHPIDWYRDRIVPVPQDHDPSDRTHALTLALDVADAFPVGVLYEVAPRPTFAESYRARVGAGPLGEMPWIAREEIEARLGQFVVESLPRTGRSNERRAMGVIDVGALAPRIALPDQDKKTVDVAKLKGKRVLLSFHPLAWTRVCALQMQALEEHSAVFESLNTVPLGLSVDPVPSKKAWAESLGITKTRLPSDFWPHGAVAAALGLFRERQGFSQRAAVILDENGVVRFVKVYLISEVPDIEEQIRFLKEM